MNHWIRRRLKKRCVEVVSYINSITPSISYRVSLITRSSYSLVFECGQNTISISGTKTETYIRVGSLAYTLLPDHGTDDFWLSIQSHVKYYMPVPNYDLDEE